MKTVSNNKQGRKPNQFTLKATQKPIKEISGIISIDDGDATTTTPAAAKPIETITEAALTSAIPSKKQYRLIGLQVHYNNNFLRHNSILELTDSEFNSLEFKQHLKLIEG